MQTDAQQTLDQRPAIGSRIRVLVNCENDLREDGMGVEHCASKGEELIVRQHGHNLKTIVVSHEHITDRSFCVFEGEYEVVAAAALAPQAGAEKGGDL